MILVLLAIAVFQAWLLFTALGRWSSVSGLISNEWEILEAAVIFKALEDAPEGRSLGESFFLGDPEDDRMDSVLYPRWLTLRTISEITGQIPFDQSYLDDELEAKFDSDVAFVRSKAGVAVLVGLLGTLLGLTSGVQGLNQALPKPGQALNLVEFADRMGTTISGFGTAFYSALLGVATAILLAGIASRLQSSTSAFVLRFREVSRTTLIRFLPNQTGQLQMGQQLRAFGEAMRALEARLPSVGSLQESLGEIRDVNQSLTEAATQVIGAYENSAKVLERPNTVSEGINRLEIMLAEHVKNTELIIGNTMAAIEHAANKQAEISEEFARMVVDMPMEVASTRLVVTDRQEFQRLNKLLEQKIDTVSKVVVDTSRKVEEVAAKETFTERIAKRFKH